MAKNAPQPSGARYGLGDRSGGRKRALGKTCKVQESRLTVVPAIGGKMVVLGIFGVSLCARVQGGEGTRTLVSLEDWLFGAVRVSVSFNKPPRTSQCRSQVAH